MSNLQASKLSSNVNNEYTFKYPLRQNITIPYTIMTYLLKNPKAFKKLIQTCKYYFSKNPIYPVQNLTAKCEGNFDADGEIFDLKSFHSLKLWLYDELRANAAFIWGSTIQLLIPSIYKCDLRSLEFADQIFSWDQFQILVSSSDAIKRISLVRCNINYSNGEIVTFDKIIENLPLLEYFKFYCDRKNSSIFKPETTKKAIQNFQSMKNMRFLCFCDLPETFDLNLFFNDFIMKNTTVYICLHYNIALFRVDTLYQKLVKLIDAIIENPPAKIPLIEFPRFYGSEIYAKYQKIYKRQK